MCALVDKVGALFKKCLLGRKHIKRAVNWRATR